VRDPHTSELHCPPTHPVHIPAITVRVFYKLGVEDVAGWRLSSDINGAAPGSTLHTDYFEVFHE
jgi:hypothetical protein